MMNYLGKKYVHISFMSLVVLLIVMGQVLNGLAPRKALSSELQVKLQEEQQKMQEKTPQKKSAGADRMIPDDRGPR